MTAIRYNSFLTTRKRDMQNWFNTLNEALASEGLLHTWDCVSSPVQYGETRSYTYQDGTRYGHYITVHRDSTGMYERPVHYPRG